MFELSTAGWITVAVVALIVGLSKTGPGGFGIVVVPLMASVFPAKESTGILLPLLIFADIFGIVFYRKYADWKILIRLIPFVIPGVILGYFFMDYVSDKMFKPIIGIIILIMLTGNFLIKYKQGQLFVKSIYFSAIVGLMAGFTTMVANAAGPIMAVFLLSMDLDKKKFMGTRAWYFLIINIFKVPFSADLGLITFQSLEFNALLLPVILIGATVGYYVVKILQQKWFEWIVIAFAVVSAVKLIFF